MAKSARRKTKRALSATKVKKAGGGQTRAAEYVDYLLELHKLQGILLTHLNKEVQ